MIDIYSELILYTGEVSSLFYKRDGNTLIIVRFNYLQYIMKNSNLSMKISFILDIFGVGGKERRCLQLIQGLNQLGYKNIQVIIINKIVNPLELYETNAKIHVINRKTENLNYSETIRRTNTLLKSFKPEIVQSWGGISTMISILLKPLIRYKLIGAYVADADQPKFFSPTTFYPLFCDKIVGNSQIGLDVYRIPKKKAILIYNGFNERRFEIKTDINEKKKSLNISTPHVIAMVAVFRPEKDWNCYLNTAKQIIKERFDITFLAVGQGKDWEKYNKTIATEERNLIRMMGVRNDIEELLQICDMTVLTSNHGEGISNSIMESMAFGIPVIATNTGGTAEIIDDGENGLLLKSNTIEELKDKILRLIDNNNEKKRIGTNASKTVQQRFLLSNMTQQYDRLYKKLV